MTKRSLLLIVAVAVLALSAYGAEAVSPDGVPGPDPSEQVIAPTSGFEVGPLFLAAGGGKGRLAGFLIPGDSGGGVGATCETFIIDCIEEEDDTCCADYETCKAYCEKICNGTCGPAAN